MIWLIGKPNDKETFKPSFRALGSSPPSLREGSLNVCKDMSCLLLRVDFRLVIKCKFVLFGFGWLDMNDLGSIDRKGKYQSHYWAMESRRNYNQLNQWIWDIKGKI